MFVGGNLCLYLCESGSQPGVGEDIYKGEGASKTYIIKLSLWGRIRYNNVSYRKFYTYTMLFMVMVWAMVD